MRMGWCKIGKEGGYAFADAIKYSSSLAVLDLRGNALGAAGVASPELRPARDGDVDVAKCGRRLRRGRG